MPNPHQSTNGQGSFFVTASKSIQ
jgi:hypothetical protein